MTFNEFCSTCKKLWEDRLTWTKFQIDKGLIQADATPLYPAFLICTDAGGFFVAELVGAVLQYSGLVLKTRKQDSIYDYLGQFEGQSPTLPLLAIPGSGICLAQTLVSQTDDLTDAKKRFPVMDRYPTQLIGTFRPTTVFRFENDFQDFSITDSMILNTDGKLVRAKHIFDLTLLRGDLAVSALQEVVARKFRSLENASLLPGVLWTSSNDVTRRASASQLQSLFLTPGMHETTIGEYFEKHPDRKRLAAAP